MVAPGSQVRLPADAAKGAVTQLVEEAGNVVFMIKKMAMPHFAVQTPYLAAVVKGTTFSVSVDDKGASVHVLEGAVDVATVDAARTRWCWRAVSRASDRPRWTRCTR